MKTINADEMQWTRLNSPREGTIEFKRMIQGRPGALNNFEFSLVRTLGDYRTPRHRHNFDQIRFILSGRFGFGPDKVQEQGTVSYFPEGVHYAQQGIGETITLLLQFGSASGGGYLNYDQIAAGKAALERHDGQFARGVLTTYDTNHKKINKDAYEAIWEHVNGRAPSYPEPRYDQPIIMEPENYAWAPAVDSAGEREDGVFRKTLGVFTECELKIAFYKLDPGARHRWSGAAGERLYYVMAGSATADGQSLEPETAIHIGGDDDLTFTATNACELFMIELPHLGHLEQESAPEDSPEAR